MRPSWASGAEFILIVLLIILITSLLIFFQAFIAIILSLTLFVSYIYGIYWLFIEYRFIISNLYPLAAMLMAFFLTMSINYLFESRQKEFIKRKFSQKVSATVVEDIIKNPSLITLEGHEKEVSLFFSDIRGFTSISESFQSPKMLISYLNRYMTPMTDIIIKNHGTVDKYIGDAIMAYWNAPKSIKNHQDYALQSAIEQLNSLDAMNEMFHKDALPDIKIGIGLHSGVVTVGEMGSLDRSDYTVIGDNVNLASRLEGLCKFYGVTLIISDVFKNALQKHYLFRELDTVRVKGKEHAITIYEVLTEPSNEALQEELNEHEVALRHYKDMNFEAAKEIFETLYLKNKRLIFDIYIKRCQEYIAHPIESFDGIYVAVSK